MATDYSLTNLYERATVAKEALSHIVDSSHAIYRQRCAVRAPKRIPTVAFCGYGRAGKDEAGKYWCSLVNGVYPSSSSYCVSPFIAEMAGEPSAAAAFEVRHQHRQFWIDACHALRTDDMLLLMRLTLGCGDVITGVRGRDEFFCIRQAVDLTVWVDNPRVPVDLTVEFAASDCDISVLNYGTLEEFFAKLNRIQRLLPTRK